MSDESFKSWILVSHQKKKNMNYLSFIANFQRPILQYLSDSRHQKDCKPSNRV